MATCKWVVVKKGHAMAARATKKMKPGDAVPTIALVDNEDGSYDVQAVDSKGFPVDATGLATLSAVTADPAVMTADVPTGFHGVVHGLTPGSTTLTLTLALNDGSNSFSADIPCTVVAGGVAGFTVTIGPPVARP